ncbi:peptidylprolyl isomerase [Ruegeria marisrubri]|uniref:Parvulin-like PPIase n=1 Tax=Ruegeria marisrubri TaxID=1685379 RepID=A0A0X3TQT2_9RHOB|nr:peptidylprolyl isomerase [Ruegeria marisrubri]KUJ78094.1 peptidylprolyl isomerase [Ruegeria marisrubri]
MPKGFTFLPSLALTVAMALPLAAETQADADTVVARVNGDEITLGHVILARASLPAQYQEIDDKQLYDAILDQLIDQSLLKQAQDGVVPKHVALALENEERSLLAAETIEDVLRASLTEEALQAAYDAKYANGFDEDEYNASHILVETEEEAKAIKAELDNGADFAELAKEKSTGPSGPNGGELGWFGKGMMVPEFEQAVIGLEKGQISEPVQTQFGWHVVILNDKRTAAAPELDEVRGELAQKIQQDAIQAKIDELSKGAQIERPALEGVGPEVIRQLDLVQE